MKSMTVALLFALSPAFAVEVEVPALSTPETQPLSPVLPILQPALSTTLGAETQAQLARLEAGGFHEFVQAQRLVLWRVLPYRSRSGDRVALSFSLPADRRAFEREKESPKRATELAKRLDAAREKIQTEAGRLLEMDREDVLVQGRLIENCCGNECDSCLLMSPAHAKRWTGFSSRPPRK